MQVSWDNNQTQLICKVAQGSVVMGYVVIDSTVGGRARGGLRMLPDIDEEEIRRLARAMTLKYGFLGLPQGGAKAGVRGSAQAPDSERRIRLETFGKAIAPLLRSGLFIPDTDMGTDSGDVRHIMRAVNMPVKERELHGTSSGYFTALTVLAGARQGMRHVGLTLSGCSVAIEGFGSVGSALAQLLAAENARIVAISNSKGAIFDPKGLDVERLKEMAATKGSRTVQLYRGAQRIDREAMLELSVDLLCPCARDNSLHTGNAPRVKARVICPGSNNPVTPEAEQVLSEGGALSLPDFVTNSGGVLGGTMEFASVSRTRIEAFVERHMGARIAWLLNEATRQSVLPRDIAVPIAERKFKQVQQNANYPTLRNRLFSAMLDLYRRGYIPAYLVGHMSLGYFEKALRDTSH